MSLLPLTCQVVFHEAASGSWNMAVDEAILDHVATHSESCPEAILRFYTWQPATLSLGYFQDFADRRLHPPSENCPLVRRLSGGGAILHDRELTYSLAFPSHLLQDMPSSQLYQIMHGALVVTFANWGINARTQPAGSGTSASAADPFLCFQRRAVGDVLIGPHKVAGSAQRKRRNAILQHGSVLLGQSTFAPELPGIKETTGLDLQPKQLAEGWLAALTSQFAWQVKLAELPPTIEAVALDLERERFAQSAWNQKR